MEEQGDFVRSEGSRMMRRKRRPCWWGPEEEVEGENDKEVERRKRKATAASLTASIPEQTTPEH
jgi:hypothetical protein